MVAQPAPFPCHPPTQTTPDAEDGDEIGGEGGAIYTGEGSTTTFKRRTIHQGNTAGNGGGALWNEGTTTLMSNGFLKGNMARVRSTSFACSWHDETRGGRACPPYQMFIGRVALSTRRIARHRSGVLT